MRRSRGGEMDKLLSRSELFRGFLSRQLIRPPWALPERDFETICTSCGACPAACPENILISGRGGLPEVDFDNGECTFCAACVEVCEPGALARPEPETRPWMHIVAIAEDCLSLRAITCRACAEMCEPGAISFRLGMNGRADPQLDAALCTGCGACHAPCPVDAISFGAPDQGSPTEK